MGLSSFQPFEPGPNLKKTRRNLPHWTQESCTYFVTFRLGDSLPSIALTELSEQKKIWMEHHPKPWTEQVQSEYNQIFASQVDRWLDQGHGSCVLRGPEIRGILAAAIQYFCPSRYHLDCFVLMPNHVHVLLCPSVGRALSTIVHSWKSYSALQINRVLQRTGPLWMDEYFDHLVRSGDHLARFRKYIAQNPRRAGLAAEEFTLWTHA